MSEIMTDFESMTADEFYTQAVPLFDAVREAMQNDRGTIASITAVGRTLEEALGYMSNAYDLTADAEIREQARVTGTSLAQALVKNTQRLLAAQMAELELERAMSEVSQQVTIH
jgi:hypothetical protein